jgi:hypothetical protein
MQVTECLSLLVGKYYATSGPATEPIPMNSKVEYFSRAVLLWWEIH